MHLEAGLEHYPTWSRVGAGVLFVLISIEMDFSGEKRKTWNGAVPGSPEDTCF